MREPVSTTVVYNGKESHLTSMWKGLEKALWGTDHTQERHHIITVRGVKSSFEFDFWAGVARPFIETEQEVIEAFSCFISDAIFAESDYSDFCDELGLKKFDEYGYEDRRSEYIYEKCLDSRRLFDYAIDADIHDFFNWLVETYDL